MAVLGELAEILKFFRKRYLGHLNRIQGIMISIRVLAILLQRLIEEITLADASLLVELVRSASCERRHLVPFQILN